jgi:hypothetical protein
MIREKNMPFYERNSNFVLKNFDTLFLLLFLEGDTTMAENRFKTKLIGDIEKMFPGCMVFHLDPNEYQGIPDLLILYNDRWATLEGKDYANASVRPNQPYYVELMNDMSFSRFIYPENKEEVLDELYLHFMN